MTDSRSLPRRALGKAKRVLRSAFWGPPPPRMPRHEWTIGVYAGLSPVDLKPHPDAVNPIITREIVTDVEANFVADPFLVRRDDGWHCFFEIYNGPERRGEIGHAMSEDLLSWDYQGVVLQERHHLSYPYLFSWDEAMYMAPESATQNQVALYKAVTFPNEWARETTMIEGPWADASLVEHEGLWWCFAGTGKPPYFASELHVFWAETPLGPWKAHGKNPIVWRNAHHARPAGRIVKHNGALYRYAQSCAPLYGLAVNAFVIRELSRDTYREEPVTNNPILEGTGAGWNGSGIHHVDAHQLDNGGWAAMVDGWRPLD